MMSVLKGFRSQVIARVLLLAASIGACLILLSGTGEGLVTTEILTGGVVIAQIILLIRYVERTNRELARFFDSIKYADFSQSFNLGSAGPSFKELHERFGYVIDQFRKKRTEEEEQLRYVDTVVQHVGIGLISFSGSGEIELVNNAARRLLRVPHLTNVRALDQLSKPLADTMLTMKAGDTSLVRVHQTGLNLQLSLHAAQFKMKDKLYTLISLQNILGELERERMSKELEIAQELQRRLLPRNGFSIEGFDIAGVCLPAEEVGGDYYDFLRLRDNKVGVVIGDVSGKGVPAAIYMTLTKGIMQAFVAQTASPKDVLEKVNSLMYGTIEKGSFMTMTYAVIDPGGKTSTFARAGHNPAILYSNASQSITHVESNGIALGMRDDATFGSVTAEARVQLLPHDMLVFYTDGVTEAMNGDQEEFGVERLFNAIKGNHQKSAHGIIEAVRGEVADFVGNRSPQDDMTLIVLKAVA
jgi:serine phosphatase RsbU (regulator of sigma subunit)